MNVTQTGNAARTSYLPPKSGENRRQAEAESFLGAVERMNQSRIDILARSGAGASPDPVSIYQSMALYGAGRVASSDTAAETQAASLEGMLKAKYPNLVYNVGDATSSSWRTRNDYPFEALFQEGEKSAQIIENWKSTGPNPENQRHIAIAPGSKAVMIHPKAQERMENDPAFAKEVFERIEAWWAYDIARNEAIAPGHTVGMSQAIAIGEDGEIANVLACGGGELTRSRKTDQDDDGYDWWAERMARHEMFMQLWLEGKTNINLSSLMKGSFFGSFAGGSSLSGQLELQAGLAAEQEITSMIENGLAEKLGDTICGIPTEEVIRSTWADIERGRSLRQSLMIL